ncbi:hypothetical protein [uncultured Alistipes sp.]|uniref:hypothetical protein n=1 Tax=uncultured Alistipes sp. TaxID=538949 RepID=UPI00266F3140|nr:hypothetical protein [uncultured Alistipes sp.]
MNYLTEIKLFNEWLETEQLPSNAIVLWYALMFTANRCGWRDEFAVSFSVLQSRTKLDRSTVWRMRKVLADRGIISVEERGGNRSALYRLHSFERLFASQRTTLTATQSDSNPFEALQGATLPATVHRLNRDSSEKEKGGSAGEERKSCAKKREMPRLNQAQFLSTLDPAWREPMTVWLEYKRSRRESYRSESGARKCLSLLRSLSGEDPVIAAAIIDRSIANNWAGLFPLRPVQPARGQHPGQIIHPATDERTRRLLEKLDRR